MAQNCDHWRYRRHVVLERLDERGEPVIGRLGRVRRSVRRSPRGLLLGVFRGIAESRGYSVFWTRVVGSIALIFLSGGSLLAAGFFYLLTAVLMQSAVPAQLVYAGGQPATPPPGRMERSPAAAPGWPAAGAPRVDFTVLDRQFDVLDRRIQSMEGVVTDRHYDWDRRLES
jgi:hypothetical protein